MALGRFGKGFKFKKPSLALGFRGKVLVLMVMLGISFVGFWFLFSSPSSQRSSFGDVENEVGWKKGSSHTRDLNRKTYPPPPQKKSPPEGGDGGGEVMVGFGDGMESRGIGEEGKARGEPEKDDDDDSDENTLDDGDGGHDDGSPGNGGHDNGDANKSSKRERGSLFDPKERYNWRMCNGRRGQNHIPCVDLEVMGSRKLPSHRHNERSCPAVLPTCLTPLPRGYHSNISWPESLRKIFYWNVAHPRLSAYVKTHRWLQLSDEYLMFPRNESVFNGDASQYLDVIGEMVPDIDWGKNIRVILDIGCTDSSFAIVLDEKDALALCLGLMNDQTDLAQVSLERGVPTIVGNLGSRRLPFPSGVFDAIHCGECEIPWHSNDGKLILEMNRILRPGGYFIMSFRQGDIEGEEVVAKLTETICWSTVAHNTDEETALSFKIYQRPSSNDVYELRMTKDPPICGESEKQDAAWYVPIKRCLHSIPAAIEQHGTDWPEEWPKRLESFPEWMDDSQEKVLAELEHWKAIVNNSYLNGIGIDWSRIRNVMDMKAIHGGFAAALASQKLWVMNVVPVSSLDTLPVIFERGLIGIYHDWCEPFSTFPRSYDLLHADHLLASLNRCREPISIVVEMDRILKPGGWAIIHDNLEILNPLERIMRSLHWEIRTTFSQNHQGMICAQKSFWRP